MYCVKRATCALGKECMLCGCDENGCPLYRKIAVQDRNPYRDQEQEVMNNLVNAWNNYYKLSYMHPSDNIDFCNGIHKCQDVINRRVLRRDYPKEYATYSKDFSIKKENAK